MGVGYERTDTGNNIANGEFVDATYLDEEFDAIVAAFHASTGHTHDGTTAEGAPITVLGPAQDFVASATDLKPKTHNTYALGTTDNRWSTVWTTNLTGSGTVTGEEFKASSDGSVGDPSYNWSSDNDTGMYLKSDGVIGLTCAGAEVISFSTSGITSLENITATGFIGPLTGNASTASSLGTARTISLTNAVTSTATLFDGSANISIPINSVSSSFLTGTINILERLPYSNDTREWVISNIVTEYDTSSSTDLGRFGFLRNDGAGVISPNQEIVSTGANLRFSGSADGAGSVIAAGSTWLSLGRAAVGESTLFIRVE